MKLLPTQLAKVLACTFATALLAAAPLTVHANNALAQKKGCLGCHAAAMKLVGPSYQAVAAKYAGQPDAKEMLALSIRNGGAGKWGDMPMPPQAQLSAADAKKLAAWILSGPK